MDDAKKNGEDLWNAVVSQVKMLLPTEMERNRTERYFPLMHSPRLEDNEFIIAVNEQIQVEMFTNLYAQLIQEALDANGIKVKAVRFVVDKKPETNRAFASIHRPRPIPMPVQRQKMSVPLQDARPPISSTMPMHESYTFHNFVVGPSNSFAHAAATAVAKNPGETSYNPLFLYGGTGLGKTHLMEAIGHYVLAKMPEKSVCYITSETFLNEYINALQNSTIASFRERYRKVDLLLLDDVQFIVGKFNVQEEFFNTFNSLFGLNKQVVMTSDVAPKDLKGCEERLIGRFQQGMVVEVESPSYETRLAILKFKMAARRHFIPDEILQFIAENIRSHVRAIEGALNRVLTFINLNPNLPLTLEITKHLLKDSIDEEKVIKDLTVDEIIRTVSTFYGVKIEDILSKCRTQTLVTPRQVAMFLSCKLTTKSLPEIGDKFDKSHATVHHGAQTIQKRLDVENDLKKSMEEIVSRLGRKFSDLG
jgi:chromosomal replication initiator protein